MNKFIFHLCFLATAFIIFISCEKDGNGNFTPPDCNTNTSKSFSLHVNPIIQSNCALSNCHATGSVNGPGALTTYTQISSAASSIRAAIVSGSMPKDATITAAQKSSIICWIDAGALNN